MKKFQILVAIMLAACALNAAELTPKCKEYKKNADKFVDFMVSNASDLGMPKNEIDNTKKEQKAHFDEIAKKSANEQDEQCTRENADIKELEKMMNQMLDQLKKQGK